MTYAVIVVMIRVVSETRNCRADVKECFSCSSLIKTKSRGCYELSEYLFERDVGIDSCSTHTVEITFNELRALLVL